MSQAPAVPRGSELPLEPRIPRVGAVDAVALEARSAELSKRSIKKDAKLFALLLSVRMMDLTTLEGADTPGKVGGTLLEGAATRPGRRGRPVRRGGVRLPEPRVDGAAPASTGTSVKVASVATAFPSGQAPLEVKLAEVRAAVEMGADEIDMVIDRGAFLSGRYAKVYDEIVAVKQACGTAHLKVILETGELGVVRQRPARVTARDGGRGRLHQDVDGEDASRPRRCR